jgi:arylsulfatase A-like enzyme
VGDDKKSSFPGGNWAPDHLEEVSSRFVKDRDKSRPFAMVMSFAPPHTGGGAGFEDRFDPGKLRAKTVEQLMGYGYAAPAHDEAAYTVGGSQYHRPVRANVPDDMPGYEDSKSVQGYFGAITAIDDAIGRFFQTLKKEGQMDNTIVVFTADHGEMMGSHGRMTKGVWFQEAIGIPMIIRYPKVVIPAQHSCVFNSIDVLPTLLGLSTLRNPGNLDGTDYSPMLRGEPQSLPKIAFGGYCRGGAPGFETDTGWQWRHFRTAYTERYTYVLTHGVYRSQAGADELLYDHQTDPYEQNPIRRGDGQDELLDRFKSDLAKHLEDVADPFLSDVWPVEHAETDWTFYRQKIGKTYF